MNERLTKEQMIALPLEELERRYPSNYGSIARGVADAMACYDLVRGCAARPALLDDPDDSVASCDVDGACDRHRFAIEIGTRLMRMRARSGS